MSASCPLEIPLGEDDEFYRNLFEQNGPTAEHIEISLPAYDDDIDEGYDEERVFHLIGDKVANVTAITISTSEEGQAILPFQHLEVLLSKRAHMLTLLRMGPLCLMGARVDYDHTFAALQKCSSLEKVEFRLCGFLVSNNASCSDASTRHSIFDALNGIETLKEVSLDRIGFSSYDPGEIFYTSPSGGYCDASGLSRLCQKRMNQPGNNINVNDFTLGIRETHLSRSALEGILGANSRVTCLELVAIFNINDNMDTIQNGLRQSTALKSFQLRTSRISAHAGLSILQALQGKKNLHVLEMDISCQDSDFEYASDLANAVNQIPSLEELVLEVADTKATRRITSAATFFKYLFTYNTSIKDFEFDMNFNGNEIDSVEAKATFKDKCCEELNKSLELVMESNDTLQEISVTMLDVEEIPLCDNILFWLSLNRIGRKQLIANLEDRQRWLDAIMDQRENAAITYHLLSLNVAVWLVSPTSPPPPTALATTKRGNMEVVDVENSTDGFKKRKN